MMKKYVKYFTLLSILILLSSCGGGSGGSSSSNVTNNTDNVSLTDTDEEDNSSIGKDFSNQSALIGVIDSSFNLAKISVVADRIIVSGNYIGTGDSTLSNGYTHGENVSLIITEGTENYIYAVGAAIGENLSISIAMYEELYNYGVRIYNQSFGSANELNKTNYPENSTLIKFYITAATTDSLFIWATGNKSEHSKGVHATASPESRLPELYSTLEKGWLSVTAISSTTGLIADYANYVGENSKNWGIAAIGDYKIGTGTIYGTSFAAAAVSKTAGNILTKYPWITADIVKLTLLTTAIDIGGSGVDSVYGWGLLNESDALNGPAQFTTLLAFDENGNKMDKITITINDEKQENISDLAQFTFSNDINGDAGLILESTNGNGILILSGVNTYTGDTVIDNAKLIVTNQINSKMEISSQGSLIAFGNSSADGSGASRTVKINNSITNNGELTVLGSDGLYISGNYTGSTLSMIYVDVDSNITVAGSMNLNNSSIEITASEIALKNIPSSDSYTINTIIKATAGLNNTGNVNTNFDNNYIDMTTPVIFGNEITVTYKRNSTAYVASSMGYMSASVMNTGENLDKVFDTLVASGETSEFQAVAANILRTPAALLPRTLDSLSGEIYASAQNLTFKQSREMNRNLSERLHLINSETTRTGTGVWFNFLGANGEIYQKGYAKADTEMWGGQIGIDNPITNKFILGGVLSATKAKADFKKYAGESTSTNVSASVYSIYNFNDDYTELYMLGRFGVGFIDTDVERDIWINTAVDHLTSNHDDIVYSFYGELGYVIPANKVLSLTPYIGLSHDTVKRGSFKEENNLFAIKSNRTTYNHTSVVLGLRAEAKFDKVKLHGTVQHISTFGKEDLSFKATYVGDTSGDYIKVKGASLANNTTWIGIGTEVELTENLSVNASYNVSVERSRISDNMGSVGFRFKF